MKNKLEYSKTKKLFLIFFISLFFLNLIAIFVEEINHLNKFHFLFYFGYEKNIPTYFSSIILLISACLLYQIFIYTKLNLNKYANHWRFLALIFALMSIDEIVGIHELFIIPLRKMFNLSGIFYFSWVILGLFFIFFMGFIYFKFLLNLNPKTRISIIIAAAVYISGAVGMEMIDGYYAEKFGQFDLNYRLMVTLEESLEMLGIIFFINALLKFMLVNDIKIQFEIFSQNKELE